MYYAEQIINGILHFKMSPEGEWIKSNINMLNARIMDLESRLLDEFNKEKSND